MSGFRFTPGVAGDVGFSASGLYELSLYFDTLVANGTYPGMVALLARGDKLVFSHVTGFADLETRAPLMHDTIFNLYSMSKPFTTVGLLLLYEEGKWRFDDPISTHLPEFRDIARQPGGMASREPSMLDIFLHTAGFTMGSTKEEIIAAFQKIGWDNARSLTELIGRYAEMPLGYDPGTAWEYGNATDLQAEIAERITGERFDLFLKRRIFDPLEMHDTCFDLGYERSRRLARSHIVDAETGKMRPITTDPMERMEAIFPMGGTSFRSTALDFARFARMLLNRGTLGETRILLPATVDLMLTNHLPDALLKNTYGAAHYVVGNGNGHGLNGLVCIDPEKAGRPVGRGTYEWGGAYSTWFWIDPENDLLFVGMSNRRRIRPDPHANELVSQEIVYRALNT
ncbi:serine hydrolase domain-containing protein [uncultured Sphingosinicella sp.]|uniref:serine hydrolase domain-containing protein n=1 Tax=uncultured Sphingosinicella sp. TaxID=478748 RepID=UPI0030DA3E1B|tara:strand:+ start:14679 stop:15875 length:1197 start_codon:yes stop_codon:yes gene_type:complete